MITSLLKAVDVNCVVTTLFYSVPVGLQCAKLLGQVVDCLLQGVRIAITMLMLHQWHNFQITFLVTEDKHAVYLEEQRAKLFTIGLSRTFTQTPLK